MASYKLSGRADADLVGIYVYGYTNFGEMRADKYYLGLMECLEQIGKHPLMYPIAPEDDRVRRCVYGINTIYYRYDENVVTIIKIRGRQDD